MPHYQARDMALVAAERRRAVGAMMRAGGRRLGGMADIARLCDPREMALAAAERRLADDVWCASGQVIDLDAVQGDENEEEERIGARRKKVVGGGEADRVPVRQNAAALAALRRAGGNT